MPTTTPKPAADRRPLRAAFTLVEVIVATTIGSMLLAAILTSFVFLGRAGVSIQNYAEMESQARKAMDTFSLDARMAYDATWNSANSVTLTVESGGARRRYTYAYNSTAGTFTRQLVGPTTGSAEVLLAGIQPGSFKFTAYKINTEEINLASAPSASADRMTKQIQISLEARRTGRTVAASTNKVVSARFVLRNKKVT
jgi:prepilin-type N-terminal cleavage/methylation domain-containing protein